MRTVISFLFVMCLAVVMPAQQTRQLNSQTITGWRVVGDAPTFQDGGIDLILPAGSQIVRVVSRNEVGLRFATKPTIDSNNADWPVIEIGSTALVFSRRNTKGQLLLVVGDEQVKELPFEFPLTEEGQSVETLTISCSQSGATVRIEDGKLSQQASIPLPTGPIELIVSAGEKHAWNFESFAVIADSSSAGLPQSGKSNSSSIDKPAKSQMSSGTVVIPNEPPVLHDSTSVSQGADRRSAAVESTNSSRPRMEVFTPQSFRSERVDLIRSVSKAAQK